MTDPDSRKYRPSNGTEGMAFMEVYCDRCSIQAMCPIIGKTITFNADDPRYPVQWVYGDDGHPTCTSFSERSTVHNRRPCNHTADLFAPKP